MKRKKNEIVAEPRSGLFQAGITPARLGFLGELPYLIYPIIDKLKRNNPTYVSK